MLDSLKNGLRDAADVLKHARGPAEVVKALLPSRVRGLRVLNDPAGAAEGTPASATVSGVSAVGERLRALGGTLEAEAVSEDGKVSYLALRGSDTFAAMERNANLLFGADLSFLSSDEAKIAFWTNIYNVLAIHGVVALGIEKSVMEIPSFFSWVAYRVGPHVLTLDDIENGVLRANAPHPVTKRRLFADSDPRLGLLPKRVDARVHAALVCASTSCPAVRFYSAEQLDAQLDMAAAAYVQGSVRVDDESRVIELPITFRYYEADFETRDDAADTSGVQAFVLRHAISGERERLRDAFAGGYRIAYARYDWSLNGHA